ncbi:amidohydrolase family protein [Bacillus suaedaesalsae]|uniref:Amidohydrolase family protein n=1 Tax=Bacillus suaedaesalsae TaxID=2810349 RepID=A0ABS2DL33_9BACI|nr:amidohydrolase family protein [Bacillus suaedaesalsae]MBM6619206.1 amidohydrolase family protein [Bacillus suaedaesalsae]
MKNKKIVIILFITIMFVSIGAFTYGLNNGGLIAIPAPTYTVDTNCIEEVNSMRLVDASDMSLKNRYKDLKVVDVHNHGGPSAVVSVDEWKSFNIDETFVFGNVSEPSAIGTDEQSFLAYKRLPQDILPFFAGVNITDESGVEYTKQQLERGFLGIGELAAASTYSPVLSSVKWKGRHPLDKRLPQIYELAAEYGAPVLLHIDPPDGHPIRVLEKALNDYPNTAFIFGHANVENTPKAIGELLKKHKNLYIDFFAGYTLQASEKGSYGIEDYIPVIEQYPDQFLFGTDGGYGMTYSKAATAIYETIHLLEPETACKMSYQNAEKLIENQQPTETQINKIQELSVLVKEKGEVQVNKREANELIFELEEKAVKLE